MICEDVYVGGYRVNEPCPYQARYIIAPRNGPMHRVCGYHARAYVPTAIYPLDWNLQRIRDWRLRNLEKLRAS